MNHLHSSLFKKLSQFFRQHREIQIAYVFGSMAKHPEKPSADMDIALLLDRQIQGLKKFNYRIKIIETLDTFLKKHFKETRPIDLILLNDADPLLAHQVIKYGKLVFERKKKLDRDFKVKTMTNYFDAKPLQDFFFKQAMSR